MNANAASLEDAILDRDSSLLLIIDMQVKLLPAMHESQALRQNVLRLARVARRLAVPVHATAHWPDKIGAIHAELTPHIQETFDKTHFNACREPGFVETLPRSRPRILLCGTEAHICVLQTGLGLARAGFSPILVADGIGSRHPADWQAACDRWRGQGLEIVTSEMAIYEWLETPSHPAFRDVLKWVK